MSRGGLYIYSPKWLKNKKATINSKNNDDKCFQYAIKLVLSYEQIKKDSQRISKIKLFIDQYNWPLVFLNNIKKGKILLNEAKKIIKRL